MHHYDFVIIGGGAIGTAIARELASRSNARIALFEKETSVAQHASGRNSGVIHAGFYYSADSLKAKFCKEGNRQLKAYCQRWRIPIGEYGKVVVAQTDEEVERIHELKKRAKMNGVPVKILNEEQLKKVEPYAYTRNVALFSPMTAVVDPVRVVAAYAEDARKQGVDIFFEAEVQSIDIKKSIVFTSKKHFSFGHLINCAGLHADRIAHLFGIGTQYTILPFRGDYYELRKDQSYLVKSNIYPVPDLKNPFLGVHFTRTIHGNVIVGPTATPVLGRENYQGLSGAKLKEALAVLLFEIQLLLWDANFRGIVKDELSKKGQHAYTKAAAKLIPSLKSGVLIPSTRSGIRAQLFDLEKKKLVSDFIVEKGENSTHVLNAVSPAFTSALPFATYLVDQIR